MLRITGPTAVDIGSGKLGFVDENLAGPVEGTDVSANWLNGVQEEIVGIIEAAGLTPAGTVQLLSALRLLFGGRGVTPGVEDWMRLPDGLIIQWCNFGGTTGSLGAEGVAENPNIAVTFPYAFPNACFHVWPTAFDVSGANLQEGAWRTGTPTPTGVTMGLTCRQASAAMGGSLLAFGY